MSRRETDYAGRPVYIAERGDPILSPDMMTVWGHFRETRVMTSASFNFITVDQFLGLPDVYAEPTETRTCKIFWEKGLWVCSDDVTQEDLAKCDYFLVHALKGPYAAISTFRALREDKDALEELARETKLDQQTLSSLLGHLIQRKIDKERRRIAA